MSNCPGCGQDHADNPPFEDCGHPQEGKGQCHTSALMNCTNHFSQLIMRALDASVKVGQPQAFRDLMLHLNSDGMAVSAWYTWMAMVHRYAVPEGMDRLAAVAAAAPPPPGPDAPAYYTQALPLIAHAYSSAVLGDFTAVEATMHTANAMLDEKGVECFLKSCAASTAVAVDKADCVPDDLSVWGMLGSQVGNGIGAQVLPILVDMVLAQGKQDAAAVVPLLKALLRLDGMQPMVTAVDILSRAMAQTVSADAMVLYGSGLPGDDNAYSGVVDVDRATPDNVSRDVMAGVWAIRASKAYADAETEDDATLRIREVARSHGDPLRFATDVVVAATQMLGYAHVMDVQTADAADADGSTPA